MRISWILPVNIILPELQLVVSRKPYYVVRGANGRQIGALHVGRKQTIQGNVSGLEPRGQPLHHCGTVVGDYSSAVVNPIVIYVGRHKVTGRPRTEVRVVVEH